MTELDFASHPGSLPRWLSLLSLASVFASACAPDDFPMYSELEGLRVLAVKADPPAIAPGQSATLSALIFDESDDEDGLRYEWSYCPLREPPSDGADCAISEEELADELGVDEISFDLGEEPTAELTHQVPTELLEALCSTEASEAAEVLGRFLPNCDLGFPLSVKLVVSRGRERIESLKQVRLLFDSDEAESNPTIDGVAIRMVPSNVDRVEAIDESEAVPIEEDGSSAVQLGERYRLFADVPESASERFVRPPQGFEDEGTEKLENLSVSWFVSSGELDKDRTAFTDGVSPLENIRPNTWFLPRRNDEDAERARLVLVIRDERGGIDWLERDLELER